MTPVDRIMDDLREARRYARTHPDEAARLAREAIRGIGMSRIPAEPACRLANNLNQGILRVRCCPAMLRGYIDGACVEIEDWAAREGKGER